MKVGILADVHGNLEALRACVEALRSAEKFICPGDIVGYGPNPNECVELLKDLAIDAVAGNHDRVISGDLDPMIFGKDAMESAIWTTKIIKGENLDYLKGLKEYLEDADYEMVHGGLNNPLEEYISSISSGLISIEKMKKPLLFVGHLHIPLVIVKEKGGNYDGWQLNDGDVIDTKQFDKVIINVGAVGQPRDMDIRASCGIFDTSEKTVEIKRVSYNISAVQEKMRKANLPDFLVERLSYGR